MMHSQQLLPFAMDGSLKKRKKAGSFIPHALARPATNRHVSSKDKTQLDEIFSSMTEGWVSIYILTLYRVWSVTIRLTFLSDRGWRP